VERALLNLAAQGAVSQVSARCCFDPLPSSHTAVQALRRRRSAPRRFDPAPSSPLSSACKVGRYTALQGAETHQCPCCCVSHRCTLLFTALCRQSAVMLFHCVTLRSTFSAIISRKRHKVSILIRFHTTPRQQKPTLCNAASIARLEVNPSRRRRMLPPETTQPRCQRNSTNFANTATQQIVRQSASPRHFPR
jgi:hypothetical protein